MDTDAGIDVSGLLCAGLELGEGFEIPTVSENGCRGAALSGTLTCPGCTFGSDAGVQLVATDGQRGAVCSQALLDAEGTFAFPTLAPYDAFALYFVGSIEGPAQPSYYSGPFSVCSEEVIINGEVDTETID